MSGLGWIKLEESVLPLTELTQTKVEWGRYSDRFRGHLHEYKGGKAFPRMASRQYGFRDWTTISLKKTENCRISNGRYTDCPVTKDH